MKYIKLFERMRPKRPFLRDLQDDIEGIVVDMLDDGFTLDFSTINLLMKWGSIDIFRVNPDTTIDNYLECLHHLFDYLNSKGYDFIKIKLRSGWIINEDQSIMKFKNMSWNDIKSVLLQRATYFYKGYFPGLSIVIKPQKKNI